MTRLSQLENPAEFIQRHIGPTPKQQTEMARAIGYDSLDALIDDTVPAAIRRQQPMDLPGPQSEQATLARLKQLASQNVVNKSYIGTGYHDTWTPAVVQRNVLENPGWYTAYTPYQPEISQGRLEALLTFQQMILDLTGMDLANASMLDEGTAAAEAMTLLHRVNKRNRSDSFLVAADCHPQTIAVVQTRAEALGIEVIVGQPDELVGEPSDGVALSAAGRVVDQVAFSGSMFCCINQQTAHDIQLVVAGPDLSLLLFPCILVLLLNDLGVVL